MHLSATPVQARGVAPGLGQHNKAVYLDWLGIDPQRLEALRADGTI
jgi:crotonobetainyl-CoA:carnitine CoA-transferase CaiB-like acyl-CoA transferase